MRKYSWIYLLLLLFSTGCHSDRAADVDWSVHSDPEKKPYDYYLAMKSLPGFFPGAHVESMSRAFRYSNMSDHIKYGSRSLIIMGGLDFRVSDKEWSDLLDFVRRGNEIILFASTLDKKIEKTFHCHKQNGGIEEYRAGMIDPRHADNMNALQITNDPGKTYGYKGRYIGGFFTYTPLDSVRGYHEKTDDEEIKDYMNASDISGPEILGNHVRNGANILRYTVGDGHIILHGAPLVLSNYFLLQPGNEQYLASVWNLVPYDIENIYLNDYYKRSADSSSLSVLWRYPATRYALLLALLALLLYVLFEGKRKQRIIPVVAPLRNDSVSFVETIGRLYFNKGNHRNLADKMVQQFLEWVRTYYYLNTNMINDAFVQQLTAKSGMHESSVKHVTELIHELRLGSTPITGEWLYDLYTTIQHFYKNNHP